MSGKISCMQGVPGHIETHYEAMAYYHQEKKICFYCKNGECCNADSKNCKRVCVGYTKCSDFISEERYKQKFVQSVRNKTRKNKSLKKKNHPDAICYIKTTNKRCKKVKIYEQKGK